MPRLALLCERRIGLDAVPDGPRTHLRNGLVLARRQIQAVCWEVERIRRIAKSHDLRFVLLKGAAYLMAGLPAAEGRLFSDIDVLVPQKHLQAAEAALLGEGWICRVRDAYNDRYYRQWMHELPPLEHVIRGTVIDVHHTITPPTSRFNVDGTRLLERARPLEGQDGLFVLQPIDMVLHSAVHLFQEGEFDHGLRDLLDLTALLDHFQHTEPDFWPGLIARAHELGLEIALHHALEHVERLFGLQAPEALTQDVAALAASWPRRRLMRWALQLALRPDHPDCRRPGERLARWLLYVRSHALRMPVRLLVPHLLRKAWMRRFPPRTDTPAPGH